MSSGQQFIEATGEDIEEAIAKGLEELGVGPQDVIVEVLEEPSRGMFGLNARPAKVRLQLLVTGSPESPLPATLPPETAPVEEKVEDDAPGDISEDAEVGKVVLTEILEKMDIRDPQIRVRRAESEGDEESEEDLPWVLNVTGRGDMRGLIGKRGDTLAALQYITRLITSRELQRRANIVVDVDNYKADRTDKLESLATRMADQAVRQGSTVTLEPMPPYERRIIHLALRDREDVTTHSVGEGTGRKVTIVPETE